METPHARWSALVFLVLAALPARAAQREQEQAAADALDLTPFAPRLGTRAELVPVRAGDAVLVSTTLRLFAFAADTGELRWSAGPPEGWNALEPRAQAEFFEGINAERLLVAPAAGERVAVAALQLPRNRLPAEDWQGINIQKSLPERRLFAFELATGRALWNHAPPRDWDGFSGPFAQRMRLIGSPLVAGERVLVPCTYDESSIDYQVACYELTTGRLMWTTFVTRGQVERNMFGRQVQEFAATPLVLDPQHGHVIAQTGFGLIAALDLVSGEIVWRAEYQPIPPPKTKSYTQPRRILVWRTTPPLVVGDTLLATPPDSPELLALDLGDGHLLWKRSAKELSTLDRKSEELAFDHLIGADEGVLFLGGKKLSALTVPGGIRSAKTPEPLWTRPVVSPETSGRARLSADVLFLLGASASHAFERQTGKERGSFTHENGLGLLVEDEALFVLTPLGLRRIER